MPRPTPKNPWVAWAIDAAERGIRAYAASWVTVVGGDYVLEAWNATFKESLVAALFGLLASALFSLAGKKRGASDSASLLDRENDPPLDKARPESIR